MSKRLAPWPDFKGNPIHEGDVIEHPSGESGMVEYWDHVGDEYDRWRVKYPDCHSFLSLQVGWKGMATVRQPA